ncbi:DarT ssDNA thymidine ADP-ribosyltransferase family protein [Streptomyces sp. NPDC008001]|uniref:DarT ssDNA thymidine ADP-ribosyltransferase family protein n=1 Tax=Streptomyces sp. NPDC008001 TaxID=3364804 RepID=UPI0036E5E1E8
MRDVADLARELGITRLCHVTKSANLAHILASGEIRPVTTLQEQSDAFRPADTRRMDGALAYTFLSVEYPNTWYLSQAASRDPHFRDWVVLTLDPGILARPGVRFSPYNSARDMSAGAHAGVEAFRAMFAAMVTGNATRRRERNHPAWWPTDDQAEVQTPHAIPLSDVRTVIVRDEEQAQLEYHRHVALGTAALLPPLSVAPVIFDKYGLSRSVRTGKRPLETPYTPPPTLAE